MTTIYFMRHSQTLKGNNKIGDLQFQNEHWKITEYGKELAYQKSKKEELQNLDIVISSGYERTKMTAKYFAKEDIIIYPEFNERKYGVNDYSELPFDFEKRQINDFNYKMPNGESLNEVMNREYQALLNVLEKYANKKILIVGHATAMMALFSKWCQIKNNSLYFNNNLIFDGNWQFCETFKLVFNENNNLISIGNIKE